MQMNGYILIHTTSDAFKSEKILKTAQVKIKLVPTPREFSSDCGISVYFENSVKEEIELLLNNSGVEHRIEIAK